jgi:hypothetical protein
MTRKPLLLTTLLSTTLIALAFTLGADSSPAPSIQGTYVLDYRELPDGKKLQAPDVIGLFTLTADHRNFNVYWKQDGKEFSLSTISTYKLTATEFSETNIYAMINDSAKGITYDTANATASSPVKITGDRVEFKLPLHDEPNVVFDSKSFTATHPGVFVDHWKKID